MTTSMDGLDIDPTNFEPQKALRIKEMMQRDFPVALVRKLEGAYEKLLNFYVKDRLTQYEEQRVTFEDLAEYAYADLQGWEEHDFC